MLEAQLASIAAKLACWRRNLPGSWRSWHVGGATCQVRGEAGMLEAQLARFAAKLACWRRNLPGSRRNVMGSKKSQEKCTFSLAKFSIVERVFFFRKYPISTLLPPEGGLRAPLDAV